MSVISKMLEKAVSASTQVAPEVVEEEEGGEIMIEDFSAEETLSAQSAWSILIVALFIRMLIFFFLVPLLWNESVKPAFGLKNGIDGRTAVAMVILIDLLF